jgi:ribosomal protein S18 acetylase RimI-like enzyme
LTTPAELVIRPATTDDLRALGRLGALLLRTHYEFDRLRFMAPGEGVEEGYAGFLATQLTNPNAVVLVAERDGAVVGYVYAAVEPPSWKELRDTAGFIHDVLVAEPQRGLGLAAALVDAAVAWLRGKGVPRVVLGTAEANERAQRLFSRLGFRRTMVEMTRELEP